MLSLLDRYIGRSVFYSTLLVLMVMLLLLMFIFFVNALGDLGKGDFGLAELTKYVLLSQPKRLYELFPTAALLGAVSGLSYLAANSELIAMRAAGVSLLRIAGSVMKVGMVFVVAGLLIGEFVVPVTEDLAQRGRAEALQTSFRASSSGLWLRNGSEFVNIGEVMPDRSMLGVNIYRFDEQRRLQSQLRAERAYYDEGAWQLQMLKESRLTDGGVQVRHSKVGSWQAKLTPNDMAGYAVNPEGLSAFRLYSYIRHLKKNQQATGRYEMAFWNKLLLPFSTAVMILLAIPFVFGQQRSGAISHKIFIGVMLGLLFNMLNLSFGYLALLKDLPPLLGALLPPMAFAVLTVYLFRRVA